MKPATKSDAIVAVVRRCKKCDELRPIEHYRPRHRICRHCWNERNKARARDRRRAAGIKPKQPNSKAVRKIMNEKEIAAKFNGRRFDA